MKRLSISIAVATVFALNAQCTHAKKQELNPKIVDKTEGPEVSKEWQTFFLSKFEGDFREGWGLFTCCGGWAPDEGQYMVVSGEKSSKFFYVKPYSKTLTSETALPEKVRQGFLSSARSFETLKDKNPIALDAVQLEYVHAVVEDETIIIQQRIRMKVINPEDKEHWSLILAFKNLVR